MLVNFAPQKADSAVLQPLDVKALVSILRSITREPRIGKFSMVAFNLQEQRVIFRQDDTSRIDFPALGEALDSLNLGTVDIRRLSQKHGETQFLADLIRREAGGDSQPDALVFAGPKAMLDQNVPGGATEGGGAGRLPCLLHELQPQSASGPLAGRHRKRRAVLSGNRVHDHTSQGYVVRGGRDGLANGEMEG